MKSLLLTMTLACTTFIGLRPALAFEAGPNFQPVICDPLNQAATDGAYSFFAVDNACHTQSLFFGKTAGEDDISNGYIKPTPGATLTKISIWTDDITADEIANVKINTENPTFIMTAPPATDCDLGQDLLTPAL